MPFIKKNYEQGSLASLSARSIFIGRTRELLFFVQQILKPEEPTYNILSIWGQGGVGKTTLLLQWRNQARTADFKEYCLTAMVDERQATPASIMEKFAQQLPFSSTFEKALNRYKDALSLPTLLRAPSSLHKTIVRSAPDIAGALVEGIPLAGPLLREGTKAATEHFLDHHQTAKEDAETVRLDAPLERLTRIFINELNHLAATKVALPSVRTKREQRILLFFDTFEHIADETVPWLLHSLLELEVNSNIVLIIAGRDPLERSTAAGPKQWLPYYDVQTMYSIPLHTFTQEETSAYLAERGVTGKERIETIWHLSRGLPLYLSLLAANTQGTIDPTKDVVDNFLHRIPEEEQTKRQVALDAALFSRPFNLDDLEAFPYLSAGDRPALYAWLLRQPFVRASSLNGRYVYHDLAQELFQRYLFQHSPKTYAATRRILAEYYQGVLEHITIQEKNSFSLSDEKLEVTLALVSQLFFLSEEARYLQAFSLLFVMIDFDNLSREQNYLTLRMLRGVVETLSLAQSGSHAHSIAQSLLQFIETSPRQYDQTQQQTWLQAADRLQKLLLRTSSTSPEVLAGFYIVYGWGYHYLGEQQQARACFERALENHSHSAPIYEGLGFVCHELKAYQQAVEHFSHGLQLFPHNPHLYYGRGRAYGRLKAYPQALKDLESAIQLRERDHKVYHNRARIYMELKEYHKTLEDLKRAFELDPEDPLAAHVQFERGCAYLSLKDLFQAITYFQHSCELNSVWCQDIFLWAMAWSKLCWCFPTSQIREHLETLAAEGHYIPTPTFASSPAQSPNFSRPYIAYVCRGVLFWFDKEFEKACVELQQAALLDYSQDWPYLAREYWREWDAPFWLGMTYLALDQEEEARKSIEQALGLEMPPILLKPLYWFEREKPVLYERYIQPLFDRYGIEASC
jgi:tetratricopeptide (TPR) repeat protein